jgi:hypothetical protein
MQTQTTPAEEEAAYEEWKALNDDYVEFPAGEFAPQCSVGARW